MNNNFEKIEPVPENLNKDNWMTQIEETAALSIKGINCVLNKDTKYQNIKVIDTTEVGRCIYLDNKLAYSSIDDSMYVETLVHPAMLALKAPSQVLILGGTNGSVINEVLKYGTVKEIFVVEKDEELISVYRNYVKEANTALNNTKVTLVVQDPLEYLKRCPGSVFDIIIMDYMYNNSYVTNLYGLSTFNDLKRVMKSTESALVLCTHSVKLYQDKCKFTFSNLSTAFHNKVINYYTSIPSQLTGVVSFLIAYMGDINPKVLSPTSTEIFSKCTHMDVNNHTIAFMPPKWINSVFTIINTNAAPPVSKNYVKL